MTLSNCSSYNNRGLDCNLPDPPAQFGTTVPVPSIQENDDSRLLLSKMLGALLIANQRLVLDNNFYSDLKSKK